MLSRRTCKAYGYALGLLVAWTISAVAMVSLFFPGVLAQAEPVPAQPRDVTIGFSSQPETVEPAPVVEPAQPEISEAAVERAPTLEEPAMEAKPKPPARTKANPTGEVPQAPRDEVKPPTPAVEAPAKAGPKDLTETVPAGAECTEGTTRGWTDNSQQRAPGWTAGVETCVAGEWVRTSEPHGPPAAE